MGTTNRDFPTAEQLGNEIERLGKKPLFARLLFNTLGSLIVAAAAAVLISMMFLPLLRVTGTSMAPTLNNDDIVVCRRQGSFERGDIIAFYYNNKILVKRVIGTSGDVIDIKEDGTVYVNGEQLDEPYIESNSLGSCDIQLPFQVPDDRVFVMGDDRGGSIDSRSKTIGCVSEELILGRVELRVMPLKRFGIPR